MTLIAVLQPAQPYHFPLLLEVLSHFAHPTLDIAYDNAYWRVLRVNGGMGLARVTAGRDRELHVEQVAGHAPEDTLLARLRQVLPMDDSRAEFYDYARGDAPLWSVVEALVGLPPWRSETLYEALMEAIIEQQIAWIAAQRAQRWLVEWGGNALDYDSQRYYAFPTPEQIAAARPEDMKPLKITDRRIALMIAVSQQVAAGTLDLEALAALPMHEAHRALVSIKGIGDWTAKVALLRACGHESVASGDVALQAAVNRYFYSGTGSVTARQVEETFARYGAFGGLAARYTLMRWVLDVYPRGGR
ncbi:MAG: DNA-3-methyladenine glycosylase 2 family protein [Anaerolineae bacterium]|nr:DNA-3-methyladenine glycosylase 2 family protein [Anaerolineae bacterium]